MVLQDQFTAKGPPNDNSGFPRTGFCTVSDGGGFQFGAQMNAVRCGVVGQTQGGGIAGVLGQGRFSKFGVLGTAFNNAVGVVGVSVSNTNELFNFNVPPGNFNLDGLGNGSGTGVLGKSTSGFGVHGVSSSNTAVVGGSDGGFGVHGISKTNTGVVGSSDSGFGIHGVSKTNTGVVGVSDGNAFGVHGIAKARTGVVGSTATGVGVHGIGETSGHGVQGSAVNGVGGVFESQKGAQIRLIPNGLASPEGRLAGAGGELVATASAGTAGLWFCAKGGSASSATWELVAGARPFPDTDLSEGAIGTHVKRVQLQLNLIAAAGLVVDGEFGPVTSQAVREFQEAQALEVDGTVGPNTWGKLFAVI